MSNRLLKLVSKASQRVLDELTDSLGVGQSRKIDRSTAFMPVHVECLHQTPIGPLFSIAHYHEQNGDLVPDPDVVFVRASDGWSPVSFQNLLAYRVAVTFHEDGAVEVDEREQRDLIAFCDTWTVQIRAQQGVPTRQT